MLNLEQRIELSKGIGASECGAVLGIDPYCTPYELWMIKTGRMVKDVANEDAVIMGNLLEPVIAKRYSQLTGERVARVNKAFTHKNHPHMLCHLDRKIVGKHKAVEIKTANPFSTMWGEAGTDEIPAHYIAQVQHQLAVTGWEHNDLIVFRGTTDLRIYPFVRDEEAIKVITDKVNHFWEEHIVKDIPPAATTRGDLKLMYPTNNGNFIQAGSNVHLLLDDIQAIKSQVKGLKDDQEKLEKDLIEIIADNDGIADGEEIIVTFKADKNGRRSLRIKERK